MGSMGSVLRCRQKDTERLFVLLDVACHLAWALPRLLPLLQQARRGCADVGLGGLLGSPHRTAVQKLRIVGMVSGGRSRTRPFRDVPPISLDTVVPRTGGHTYDVGV